MAMAVAMMVVTLAATTVIAVIVIITASLTTALHAVIVIAVHGRVVLWIATASLDEIHRLVTGVVLTAIVLPVLVIFRRHTHVNGALLHAVGRWLDDDRLLIDQNRLLTADVNTAINAWLVHADAHTDLWDGVDGGGAHHQGGSQGCGARPLGDQRAKCRRHEKVLQKGPTREGIGGILEAAEAVCCRLIEGLSF